MTLKMDKAAKLLMIISMITNLTLITNNQAASLDLGEIKGDESIGNCDLMQDCDVTKLSTQSYESYFKKDRHSWDSLGLDPKSLQINQIALGFVPAFQEKLQPNSPEDINKKLFKPMSIMGDYVALTSSGQWKTDIDWKLPIVQALDGKPVWCLAMMPSEGAEIITWELAHEIADKLAWVNKQGVTVWLRLMYEMNGNWNVWGMKPKLFKKKWTLVANAVKQKTHQTYMLWSPNVAFGDSVNDVRGGYTAYWPDASTVDIAGVSYYHWGINATRTNVAPTQAEAVDKLVQFSKIYGKGGWNKPIVVSETAACYTSYPGTRKSVGGNANEITIKMTWLHLLLDRYILPMVPTLKAVIWFEIVKNEIAPGKSAVYTEDFRLVMGNPDLAEQVRKLFASYHAKEQQLLH